MKYYCKICGEEKEQTLEEMAKIKTLDDFNVCDDCLKQKETTK
jgi:hypothetical protein